MKLETLQAEWDKDAEFDLGRADEVIRKIPLLHAKYWRIFVEEKLRRLHVRNEYAMLRHLRYEYYAGRLDDAERIKQGWPVQPLRLVKQDIDSYLEADPILVPLKLKVETQEIKMSFLEDVIKSINNRNFLVKNGIEWLRFSNGA